VAFGGVLVKIEGIGPFPLFSLGLSVGVRRSSTLLWLQHGLHSGLHEQGYSKDHGAATHGRLLAS